jgi:dolichol-phosphate mannosyltransferase
MGLRQNRSSILVRRSPVVSALRLVVPAYNEAANLTPLLERIDEALSGKEYIVFIVDDGSEDETAALARELAERFPVRLLEHSQNRGIATAFLTGLRAAVAESGDDDAICVLEGDGTSDPALLSPMARALESGIDVAIASRHVAGGGYRGFPLKRLLLSRAANFLLRIVCRLPGVRDYTIFYRAYRSGPLSKALEAYGDRFTSVGGFACNAEMLLCFVWGPLLKRRRRFRSSTITESSKARVR